MADCERFEIEIGMRQHGALDAAEEAALDQHLAGCVSCRAFAAAGGVLDAALRSRAVEDAAHIDWTRLQEKVRAARRSYRLKLWLAPLFLLQLPLSFLLATGHLPDWQLLQWVPFTTVGIYVLYVWLVNRPFREVMAVARSSDDLLRGYVRELRRRRLRARLFAAVNLLLAAACVVAAVFSDELTLYKLLCALVFSGWAIYDLALALPRLHEALAEVES